MATATFQIARKQEATRKDLCTLPQPPFNTGQDSLVSARSLQQQHAGHESIRTQLKDGLLSGCRMLLPILSSVPMFNSSNSQHLALCTVVALSQAAFCVKQSYILFSAPQWSVFSAFFSIDFYCRSTSLSAFLVVNEAFKGSLLICSILHSKIVSSFDLVTTVGFQK